MAFRFRKSVKLLPGVRVNLSKSGASLSLGGKGFRHTIGHGKQRTTVGILGTGLSYSKVHRVSTGEASTPPELSAADYNERTTRRGALALLCIAAIIACSWASTRTREAGSPALPAPNPVALEKSEPSPVILRAERAEPPRRALPVPTVAPVAVVPARVTATPHPHIAWYAAHPKSWPNPVRLTTPVVFPVTRAGKVQGSMTAPSGSVVEVLRVWPSGDVDVSYANAVKTIPARSTDLLTRQPATGVHRPVPYTVPTPAATVPVAQRVVPVAFATPAPSPTYRDYSPPRVYTPPVAPSGPKTVRVSGYYRKNGTYVRPHSRSRPRR